MNIDVNFWGTRGSYPQSGTAYEEFGGHTSCVSLHVGDDVYVIDAGSGLTTLGGHLENLGQHKTIHLFLSHLHMDHIMGLPAFMPMWDKTFNINIYSGIAKDYGGIEAALGGFFRPPYFPVPWHDFAAHKQHHDFEVGSRLEPTAHCHVDTISLNHPDEGCGYRFHMSGRTIVYLSDTNHTDGFFEKFIVFAKDADLLIYDAAYDNHSYATRSHFGHSTWEKACELAIKANVKHLALFHHDFQGTDDSLRDIEEKAKGLFPNAFAARCGQRIAI